MRGMKLAKMAAGLLALSVLATAVTVWLHAWGKLSKETAMLLFAGFTALGVLSFAMMCIAEMKVIGDAEGRQHG